jgi:hypothetical protein
MEEGEAADAIKRMTEHLTQTFAPKWRENSPGFHYKNDENKWTLVELVAVINGNFRFVDFIIYKNIMLMTSTTIRNYFRAT